jgi:rhodanese-related sulfurtransferase
MLPLFLRDFISLRMRQPSQSAAPRAGDALAAIGYTKVAHYPEGKQEWMEAGFPVEKAA